MARRLSASVERNDGSGIPTRGKSSRSATELAEAAPGIIVERLIADALGGEQDKENEADEDN
jgi:hypothetical protein